MPDPDLNVFYQSKSMMVLESGFEFSFRFSDIFQLAFFFSIAVFPRKQIESVGCNG